MGLKSAPGPLTHQPVLLLRAFTKAPGASWGKNLPSLCLSLLLCEVEVKSLPSSLPLCVPTTSPPCQCPSTPLATSHSNRAEMYRASRSGGCPSLHPIYVAICISPPRTSCTQPGQARMSVRREMGRKEGKGSAGGEWGEAGSCLPPSCSGDPVNMFPCFTPVSRVCDSVLSLCPCVVRSLSGHLCKCITLTLCRCLFSVSPALCVPTVSVSDVCVWAWVCVCESCVSE